MNRKKTDNLCNGQRTYRRPRFNLTPPDVALKQTAQEECSLPDRMHLCANQPLVLQKQSIGCSEILFFLFYLFIFLNEEKGSL